MPERGTEIHYYTLVLIEVTFVHLIFRLISAIKNIIERGKRDSLTS